MERDKILIISEENEKSTDEVIKYLELWNIHYIRINETDFIEKTSIKISGNKEDIVFQINEIAINLGEIKSSWYRRGKINLSIIKLDAKLKKKEIKIYNQYIAYYIKEITPIVDYLNAYLRNLHYINSNDDNKLSKLTQLCVAKKNGLNIPNTYYTNNYNEIKEKSDYYKFIIKAIRFHIFYLFENKKNYSYEANTSILLDPKKDFIYYNNPTSLISCFQEYVEKKFEIRIFYLNRKCYSMAIFSQQNEKTKIDFRNYDYERPNRCIEFCLPQEIESKIIKMMIDLNLNSGSIDLIYNTNNEYVFLEVNPIGQFDWLSKKCNYHIEKLIALELIK